MYFKKKSILFCFVNFYGSGLRKNDVGTKCLLVKKDEGIYWSVALVQNSFDKKHNVHRAWAWALFVQVLLPLGYLIGPLDWAYGLRNPAFG